MKKTKAQRYTKQIRELYHLKEKADRMIIWLLGIAAFELVIIINLIRGI